MRRFFCFILTSIIFLFYHYALAQDSTLAYNINIIGALSTPSTPFWMHSNTNGTIPVQGSFLAGQFGFYRKYNNNDPRFAQWSAGAELITNTGSSNNIFFTDLYLAGKLGPVELSIGQRKEFTGLADSILSSGSIAMGNNNRPYPKVQISTPKFFNVFPGDDFLAIKFSYSDGLLGSAKVDYGNVSEVPHTYLHQKSLYFRIGGPHQNLNLFAGFNHQAMWGGEQKIFSGGLRPAAAYKYVIFGKPWLNSRVGNHFGTIDLGALWNGSKWNIFLYRQNIYEDGSLAKLSNVADGLSGLRFKRTKSHDKNGFFTVNTILVEYIYTKSQGGSVFDFTTGTFGNDNYFNHYVYSQGWSYKGRSLGTPLISPQGMYRSGIPTDSSEFTVNNRISALHLGLNASLRETTFTLKGTFSNNFGTYYKKFKPAIKQTTLIVQAERPISFWAGSLLSISIAADFGKLYTNNSAISVGWRKNGFIKY